MQPIVKTGAIKFISAFQGQVPLAFDEKACHRISKEWSGFFKTEWGTNNVYNCADIRK